MPGVVILDEGIEPGRLPGLPCMDSDWLGGLVDRYAATLELYARQWCAVPEDVVQEAFLKLVAQRPRPDQPGAWLFRVVRNGAINAAVAARRRRQHEAEAAGEFASWFEGNSAEPGNAALDAEEASAALQSLPLEQREVIVAHLWGGLTFEQIGELTGCSSSTAHRCYTAGLSAIRERLGVTCRKSRPIQN
jgi:RNA polymerase sigma factor (sigma-70 family)